MITASYLKIQRVNSQYGNCLKIRKMNDLQKGFSNVLFENFSTFLHQLSFLEYSLEEFKKQQIVSPQETTLLTKLEMSKMYCVEKEKGVDSEGNKRENLFMEIKAC